MYIETLIKEMVAITYVAVSEKVDESETSVYKCYHGCNEYSPSCFINHSYTTSDTMQNEGYRQVISFKVINDLSARREYFYFV